MSELSFYYFFLVMMKDLRWTEMRPSHAILFTLILCCSEVYYFVISGFYWIICQLFPFFTHPSAQQMITTLVCLMWGCCISLLHLSQVLLGHISPASRQRGGVLNKILLFSLHIHFPEVNSSDGFTWLVPFWVQFPVVKIPGFVKGVVYDSNPIHFCSNSANISSQTASFLLCVCAEEKVRCSYTVLAL